MCDLPLDRIVVQNKGHEENIAGSGKIRESKGDALKAKIPFLTRFSLCPTLPCVFTRPTAHYLGLNLQVATSICSKSYKIVCCEGLSSRGNEWHFCLVPEEKIKEVHPIVSGQTWRSSSDELEQDRLDGGYSSSSGSSSRDSSVHHDNDYRQVSLQSLLRFLDMSSDVDGEKKGE